MGKINKIVPSKLFIPGAHSNELSYVFIEPAGEHDYGSRYVFGMFQVRSTSELYHNIIAQIVKNINDYFERTPASVASQLNQSGTSAGEFIFENALQYTNEHLTNFLAEHGEEDSVDTKKMSMLIGMVWDNELYISSLGRDIDAFYLYPVQKKDSFSHYSAVSVVNHEDDSSEGGSRMFSNIVSGNVSIPESTLVVCNKSFLDYISVDQIKQATSSYTHERLAPYFQNLLGKANTHIDFAALFMRITASAIEVNTRTANHPQTVSHHSMEDLISKERGTETILSPAVASQARDVVISMTKKIIVTPAKWLVEFTVTRVKNLSLPDISNLINKDKIINNLKTAHGKIKEKSHDTLITFHKLRQKDKKEVVNHLVSSIRERGLSQATTLKEKLLALSPVSKAILVVAVIFIALFAISIATQQAKQSDKKAQNEYNSLVSSVSQQANLAEASLIYEDEEKSKSLITEAERRLATLPNKTIEQQNKIKELQTQIDLVKKKISRIMPLNTSVVAQLENQIPTLESLRMTLVGETELLYNRDSVYTLDAKNGKALQINTQAKVPQITCAIGYTANIAYLCGSEEGRLFELDTKEQSAKEVSLKNEKGLTVSALTTYNKRLYLVDGVTGSIYRHTKLNDGFGSATILVQNLNEIKNATSIAIDGNIYVLANNQIYRVSNKTATASPLPIIEPAISSPTSIWTSDESSYLYITEPAQKRIIVVEKSNNKVKAQLTADSLGQMRDIVVNEKKREVFILSGSQVMKAALDFMK